MGQQRVALVSDTTTTGGKIITGNSRVRRDSVATVLVGDKVFCPKCKKIGTVIHGCNTFSVDGIPVAYNGCLVACGCPSGSNRIIATQGHIFVEDSLTPYTISESLYTNPSNEHANHFNNTTNTPLAPSQIDTNRIRTDANALIECAEEVCEKHLYYPENQQAFMDEITTFAQQIVSEVESGQKSYEQGCAELKTEEKSLDKQIKNWSLIGLSVLGGIGLTMTGLALCSTGVGCVIGGILVAHGANGIEEGVRGIIAGDSNQSGFLKDTYKAGARELGFDEGVGELAYNLIDLGVSVHGKLKLIPKLNEYGNPIRKLFYYGRKDLEMAYKQMSSKLLGAEILMDANSLSNIVDKVKHLFIFDSKLGKTNMVIVNPERVSNVG